MLGTFQSLALIRNKLKFHTCTHVHSHYGQVGHWAWESSRSGIGHSIHMWQNLIHR